MFNDVEHLRDLIAEAKRLAKERGLGALEYLLGLAEIEAASIPENYADAKPAEPRASAPQWPWRASPRRR